MVTIQSDLANDAEAKQAGQAFCQLIRASDVADTTKGHELLGESGESIRKCEAALAYP